MLRHELMILLRHFLPILGFQYERSCAGAAPRDSHVVLTSRCGLCCPQPVAHSSARQPPQSHHLHDRSVLKHRSGSGRFEPITVLIPDQSLCLFPANHSAHSQLITVLIPSQSQCSFPANHRTYSQSVTVLIPSQ